MENMNFTLHSLRDVKSLQNICSKLELDIWSHRWTLVTRSYNQCAVLRFYNAKYLLCVSLIRTAKCQFAYLTKCAYLGAQTCCLAKRAVSSTSTSLHVKACNLTSIKKDSRLLVFFFEQITLHIITYPNRFQFLWDSLVVLRAFEWRFHKIECWL